MSAKIAVESGKRFGRWTVLREVAPRMGDRYILARCDCGIFKNVQFASLRRGASQSCGCLILDTTTKHGHAGGVDKVKSPEYRSWDHMIQRCQNANFKQYADYGGRGINVCKEWHDFRRFFADVGARPSLRHTLERIDNDRDYEPNNVKWATRTEQNRNHRRNVWVEFNGRRMVIQDWASECGISAPTLKWRLKHWSIERALTQPPGAKRAA